MEVIIKMSHWFALFAESTFLTLSHKAKLVIRFENGKLAELIPFKRFILVDIIEFRKHNAYIVQTCKF